MVPTQVTVVGERRRSCEAPAEAFWPARVITAPAEAWQAADGLEHSDGAVQPFLDVRPAVLNDTLEGALRTRYSGFRPANDEGTTAAAA
jgi:hypothetical protein